MKQLLILSGKGGTGKTTIASSFIQFAKPKAFADCDVDAPNLHLITHMNSSPIEKDYFGSSKAHISEDLCIGCQQCLEKCRFHAINYNNGHCRINPYACEGCGVCRYICPVQAVELIPDISGKTIFYKDEQVFSTAKLKIGRGNSGKLVSEVKQAMKNNVEECDFVIIDGSPGIGCPVISSISGVDAVLIVAEPSLSGLSDLQRLVKTIRLMNVKMAVCVNKYDSHIKNTHKIIDYCKDEKIPFVGCVPYDQHVFYAINAGKSVADTQCEAAKALYKIYKNILKILNKGDRENENCSSKYE